MVRLPGSDELALASLLVSCLAALYARSAFKESARANALSFRSEWLAAYKLLLEAHRRLTPSTGPFAKPLRKGNRDYPDPLPETLVAELRGVASVVSLWADAQAHDCIQEALTWHAQLELNVDQRNFHTDGQSAQQEEQLDQESIGYAEEARRSLGRAIEIVRHRLKESAP